MKVPSINVIGDTFHVNNTKKSKILQYNYLKNFTKIKI